MTVLPRPTKETDIDFLRRKLKGRNISPEFMARNPAYFDLQGEDSPTTPATWETFYRRAKPKTSVDSGRDEGMFYPDPPVTNDLSKAYRDYYLAQLQNAPSDLARGIKRGWNEFNTGFPDLRSQDSIAKQQGYNLDEGLMQLPADLVPGYHNTGMSFDEELLPLLEGVSQQNKSLLIVAEDVDGEALAAMIVNKMRGILKCAAVKAPDFGERRTMILEDMAALTGGTVVSKQKGMKLDKVTFDMLGSSRGVTITKDETTIVDGNGKEEDIETRLNEIKDQIEKAESNYAREQLQQRLGKLAGGVAVINVGGHTEAEMNERKDRVDDAVHAVKAAIEEGILPGGGHALLCASNNIENNTLNEAQDLGYNIIKKSIRKPFYQILSNAGYNHEKCTLAALNVEGDFNKGWNLTTENKVNMLSEGIIDPTKVTRCALENAASAAGVLLTTECVMAEAPKENNNSMPEQPIF